MRRWPIGDIGEIPSVSLADSALPLVIMVLVAAGLPWVLSRRKTRSHIEVAVAVWASAGLTLLVGAALFAWIYADNGADVRGAWAAAPLATVMICLRPSLLAVIAWGPALALSWYGLAQRVERLRGEDLMNGPGE